MGLSDWLPSWLGGGTDAGSTGGGGSGGGGGSSGGGGRRQVAYRKCLNCGGEHIASALACPGDGKRIRWAPDVPATQVSIATWAVNAAITLTFVAGVIYLGPPAAVTRGAIAVGIGLVASSGSSEAGTTPIGGESTTPGDTTTTVTTNETGTPTDGSATTLIDPSEVTTWRRTGPFYASADTEGRLPKYMQVNGTAFTYTVEKEGKTWTNTMTWDGLPPETLTRGQEVRLTMNTTTQEGWANVGGWWNINCQTDTIGDASAGSLKHYRTTGGPHNIGDITFKFDPKNSEPYIQLSAGHDPAPDTWVLITFKYVPQ